MTRPILATCLLALSILACSLQPIPARPPIREYERVVFTPAFRRHNLDPIRVNQIRTSRYDPGVLEMMK